MARDHVPPELFEEEVYDRFYGEALEQVAPDNARLIAKVAGLQAGDEVLDAPCGNGRVSVQLAEQFGCNVVGVDRSERFIAQARARPAPSRGHVRFETGDLAHLDFELAFDAVVCWYTSFGYLDRDSNRAVLRSFARALRPGGRLVLEYRNPVLMCRAVEAGGGSTAHLIDQGDDLLFDRITFDGQRSRTERFVVVDGRVRRLEFSLEILDGDALDDALTGAGFESVTLLDQRGAPFAEDSKRLVAVAAIP